MAIYQFTIELIPEVWCRDNNYDVRILYDSNEQLYDLSMAWKDVSMTDDLYNMISKILSPENAWHSNLKIWGDSEHNDIQLWLNDKGNIETITIRLDLRSDFEDILEKIIVLAKKLDCALFLPEFDKIVVTNNNVLLKSIIRDSQAFKFAEKPMDYLDKIERKK